MLGRGVLVACLLAGLVSGLAVSPASAAVTPDQKKEIIEINRSMGVVSAHIRKKEYAEAEEILKTVEAKIGEIAQAAGVEATDKAFATVNKTLAGHRKNLDKAQGKTTDRPKNEGVSFTTDIAPLINEKCVGCHGATRQSGNLRLDTFAGWVKGGKSGPLLTVGNPKQSLILFRMGTPDEAIRMPKDEEAIDREKLVTMANWITQGANFDGESQDVVLSRLRTKKDAEEQEASIIIAKPKGTETVSFTKDIAPFMANLCVGCHSGNNPRGGLSLETFYDMMKGGVSGHVVLPGKPKEDSRLFRLTGGLENPRMPNNNQTRITRKNYEDLKKWFDEGCVYDGVDPKTPLRSFVRSEAEMAMEKVSSLSPAELLQMRKDRSTALLKKALPNDTPVVLESESLIIYSNSSEARSKQAEAWATQQVDALRKGFNGGPGSPWKGKLAVFLLKDRFSYEEFAQASLERAAPKEMHGHVVVTPTLEDAYIAVEDVGDEISATSGGLHINLIDQLTGAYLKRNGARLPDWLLRGTGLSLAMKVAGRNAYFDAMPQEAAALVPTLVSPQDVFNDSSFSASTIGAVGLTLVEFLMSNGGPAKFGEFVKGIESGTVDEASNKAYGVDAASLGGRFRNALKGK